MLKRNATVLWRELDGEAVLLDPKAGCSYNLNHIGTLVWKMLDGTNTAEDIVSVICERYEVEPEQALHDMKQLLVEMGNNNLLGEVPSATHPTA